MSSEDEEIESEEEHMEMEYKRTDTESEDKSIESKTAVSQQLNQSELNENHKNPVGNMLSAFHDLECNMSIKVHFSVQSFKQISRQSWSLQK